METSVILRGRNWLGRRFGLLISGGQVFVLLDAIDPAPFRMNNLTACFLWRSKLPFAFPTDRECVQSGLQTCWQPVFDRLRMAIIPNTLELDELWVSPPLIEEAKKHPHLEVLGPAQPLPFDRVGNVVRERLFPHSVGGRRCRWREGASQDLRCRAVPGGVSYHHV